MQRGPQPVTMQRGPQPVFSVVIPIFNEEEIIGRLHACVSKVLDGLGDRWEIVYVNDGSTDGSLAQLVALQRLDPRVVVLELSRNWGHQGALTAGLRAARGRAVMMMDGDLQDPPPVLARMAAAWRSGAQVVVAQRSRRHESGFRAWAIPLFYKMLGLLSDFPLPLNAGIFGLLDRELVDQMNRLGEHNRFLPGLRAWLGYRTAVVHYDRPDRAAGLPKQSFGRLTKYALDAIFSFSYKPLRLSLAMGSLATVFAVACALALGIGAMFGAHIAGSAFVVPAVVLLGGMQLLAVGVLGEYIGRIYEEVRRRPLFLVRRTHRAAPRAWAPAPQDAAVHLRQPA